MVFASSEKRRDWLGKIKWGDLGLFQFALQRRMEKLNVGRAARTKRLHGQRVAAGLAKVMEEQAGEQRLANTSIGAGNENDSWFGPARHTSELTTNGHELTRIKLLRQVGTARTRAGCA